MEKFNSLVESVLSDIMSDTNLSNGKGAISHIGNKVGKRFGIGDKIDDLTFKALDKVLGKDKFHEYAKEREAEHKAKYADKKKEDKPSPSTTTDNPKLTKVVKIKVKTVKDLISVIEKLNIDNEIVERGDILYIDELDIPDRNKKDGVSDFIYNKIYTYFKSNKKLKFIVMSNNIKDNDAVKKYGFKKLDSQNKKISDKDAYKNYNLMKESIDEGISSEVYHYTTVGNGVKIVHENKLKCSSSILDYGEIRVKRYNKTDKVYYISTARSKDTEYLDNEMKDSPVIGVKMDGNKLKNAGFNGYPIDFFKHVPSSKEDMTKVEMEDRIVTDKPYIDNFLKYVTKVDIILHYSKGRFFEIFKKEFNECIETLTKHNIPINYYTNLSSYRKNKKIELELPVVNDKSKPYIDITTSIDSDLLLDIESLLQGNRVLKYTGYLAIDTFEFRHEIINQLNAVFNTNTDKFTDFIKLMKKYKCEDLMEVFTLILDKGHI